MKLIIQIQTVISKMRKYLLQSSIRYNFQHKNISHGISHIRNYTYTITPMSTFFCSNNSVTWLLYLSSNCSTNLKWFEINCSRKGLDMFSCKKTLKFITVLNHKEYNAVLVCVKSLITIFLNIGVIHQAFAWEFTIWIFIFCNAMWMKTNFVLNNDNKNENHKSFIAILWCIFASSYLPGMNLESKYLVIS